jgi:cytochrome c oxidase assembly factor CtaG
MAISSRPWYAGYAGMGLHGLLPGGLTAAEDQQLAGLIMWIPGGLVHFVAALVFAYGALKHGKVPGGSASATRRWLVVLLAIAGVAAAMPNVGLNDQEACDVAAFLYTLD